MIVTLSAIAGGVAIASLAYTARIVRLSLEAERAWLPPKPDPPPPPKLTRFEERRRILERDRAEWVAVLPTQRATGATKAIAKIDEALLALADEEAAGSG
jgi:hypothetical protein